MTPTDLKLYEILGDKTLSFGVLYVSKNNFKHTGKLRFYPWRDEGDNEWHWNPVEMNNEIRNGYIEIIGHEPTSTDLFKWMIDNDSMYATLGLWDDCLIFYGEGTGRERVKIPFDLSKKLIDQSEETKLAIISLITSSHT